MSERAKFVLEAEEGVFSMTELCQRFGISRKTGYKWLGRYRKGGLEALAERSRAPHSIPHRTPAPVEEALVALRRKHPLWGARKLLVVLARRQPELVARFGLPAASTTTDILKRHGLITPRRKRRRPTHPGRNPIQAQAPNDVWTADFKGEFLLGNHRYCYPLTICDTYSRFILACEALASTRRATTQSVFTRLFREYGLPRAIRSDNGTPFASIGLHRLSALSVYFIKLGIRRDLIEPGSPQQNGRHERMHRTLKAATTRPPERTMSAQQARFDVFREEFNTERPHESIEMQPPASLYAASPRRMPARLPAPKYAGHLEVRRVGKSGSFRWRGRFVFLTMVLSGEYVGLEEVDDGRWDIYFYDVLVARYDERENKLHS
jgi:transposase InsO family protein